jgi:hypothetical protein
MTLALHDVTLELEPNVPYGELLEYWRWLVDESFSPILLSAMGDLFLSSADGTIYRLDTALGRLERIADDRAAFESAALRPENLVTWFRANLLETLRETVNLKPGQCYGYRIPPLLSGKIEAENFEPTSLGIHFGILGQVADQVRATGTGQKIDHVWTESAEVDPSNFATSWMGLREIERNRAYHFDELNMRVSVSPEVAAYMARYGMRGMDNKLKAKSGEDGKAYLEGTAEIVFEVSADGTAMTVYGRDYVGGVPEPDKHEWTRIHEGMFL